MKIKFTFLAILALISATTFSQKLSLELYSNVIEENKFISSMDYNENFDSNEELIKEVERLVKNLEKHNIQLLDTRKTTPGLREFEKFAVSVGGGTNHRFSLKEAVMIKDNHLIGNPNLKEAVDNAAKKNPGKDIQVEVDTKTQLEEALDTKATSILLDNFSPKNK